MGCLWQRFPLCPTERQTDMTPYAALVTGANRGIGAHLLEDLQKLGPVIGTMRSDLPPDEGNVTWATLDVTEKSSHAALAQRLNGAPIERLVCNAGVFLDRGNDIDTGFDPELWAKTFAVNVTGVFLTIQALLPNLRAAQTPKIAILSSYMGSSTRAPGGNYIYCSSKAAVLNFGRNLSVDLKPEGIAVGVYHPGHVRTDMGGAAAPVGVAASAAGMAARIEALNIDTTGCFETFEGDALPY